MVRVGPLWFKRAVFYEIHTRGFFDSDDDGSGDLRGIQEKLDYLQWLGIDCIWLLPMGARSRRRLRHRRLLRHPRGLRHRRGLQEPRRGGAQARDPDHRRPRHEPPRPTTRGSRLAHRRRRPTATTTSGRTPTTAGRGADHLPRHRGLELELGPVRGQYYWHRFFHHQPDLNYRNPKVQEEMLDALRFWLDLGIDGFRMDAVPYLYERDGTNGENLPRRTSSSASPRGGRCPVPRQGAARRGEPVAGRRRRVLR